MKLSDQQIEQTLTQFEAEPLPADHPAIGQLQSLFGDHTFFLDGNGLNIVEPLDAEEPNSPSCLVMNLANWADASASSLRPHAPEPTDVALFVELGRPH